MTLKAAQLSWRAWALALGLLGLVPAAGAQDMVSRFSAPEWYPPPNQDRKKSLLSGQEGVPQPDGSIRFKMLKIETFRLNGEKELIAEAPECFYFPSTKQVSSSGLLQVRNGDNTFFIEGSGFLFVQTNTSLVISNNVHTILHQSAGITDPQKP